MKRAKEIASTSVFAAASIVVSLGASDARAVSCDGTELLCLNLSSASEIIASGGEVVGGDFVDGGFRANDRGGLDWDFGPSVDLSSGRLSFEVKGLLPTTGGDIGGGKRSLFDLEGIDNGIHHGVQLQKMAEDYRDGHIFRMGMDDDGLADNWDAAIITGSGFQCGRYSIADWGPNEVHRFDMSWSRSGLTLSIDDWDCSVGGNGDTFDPAFKTFTLANRVQHFPLQNAQAVFRNMKLWAASGGEPPPPPPPPPPPVPGAIRISPAHDATVARGNSGENNTSYGFEPELWVGADLASIPDRATFLNFNLASLDDEVASAKLYLATKGGGGPQSIYGSSTLLRGSTVLWNEQNLTWENAPLPSTEVIDSVPNVTAGSFTVFDVTPIARRGERLVALIVSSSPDAGVFHSREHGVAAERPYLEVVTGEWLFRDGFEDGTFDAWELFD